MIQNIVFVLCISITLVLFVLHRLQRRCVIKSLKLAQDSNDATDKALVIIQEQKDLMQSMCTTKGATTLMYEMLMNQDPTLPKLSKVLDEGKELQATAKAYPCHKVVEPTKEHPYSKQGFITIQLDYFVTNPKTPQPSKEQSK
jgi:hypothetical protein